jgi:enoyl-CoA hydratase/carnithine racemase
VQPIIAALNGPAIGASVTTATLCDAIVASEKATLSTPFAKLGIPPEGCSSVHFERIMGAANAAKMLKEGWAPTAAQAKAAGFVHTVTPHAELMPTVQRIAEEWARDGKVRDIIRENRVAEYKAVNARESRELADAFLAPAFLQAQYDFLSKKGKTQLAAVFWLLKTLRPVWIRMM